MFLDKIFANHFTKIGNLFLGNSTRGIFFQGVITNSTKGQREGRGTNDLQKMSNEKIIWQGETASPIFNPVIPIPPFSLCPIEQLGVS